MEAAGLPKTKRGIFRLVAAHATPSIGTALDARRAAGPVGPAGLETPLYAFPVFP
jgi:hypothetical protein